MAKPAKKTARPTNRGRTRSTARTGAAKPAAAARTTKRTGGGGGGGRGNAHLLVGIDLGGTNMQIGVVTPDNQVIGRARRKTMADRGTEAILARIIEGVQHACLEAKVTPQQLEGVGIGAPGAIDPTTGVVLQAPNLRWTDVPLAKLLRERLRTPVVLENDVNAAIYGEWRLGAGRGCDHLMGVWVGTGVGGGFVLNGSLYQGGFFTAGEIGHMPMVESAPFGRRSVEQNCSRTAVVDRIVALIKSNNPSRLKELADGDLSQIKSSLLGTAYSEGDGLAQRVLDELAEMLGEHIGGCVTLLSLKRVVMGGGLTEALGEAWVKKVRKAVRETAFPDRCKDVEVVASELEDDAGLLGAALIARGMMK